MEKSAPFTEADNLFLVNLCTANESRINPNSRTPDAEKVRSEAWAEILTTFNAKHPNQRTTQQLKRKWDKLKSKAKAEANSEKKEMKKTGGGVKKRILSDTSNIIVQHLGQTPAFSGIPGAVESTTKKNPKISSSHLKEMAKSDNSTEDQRRPIRPSIDCDSEEDIELTMTPQGLIETPQGTTDTPKRKTKREDIIDLQEIVLRKEIQVLEKFSNFIDKANSVVDSVSDFIAQKGIESAWSLGDQGYISPPK